MIITFVGNFEVDYSSENHHKKSLESLGHTVITFQENKAIADNILESALKSDLLVWVHTHGWSFPNPNNIDILKVLKAKGIPSLTYHLDLWLGLERQKDLENDPFYKDIEYFFTVDRLMADWFNKNTDVKGRFMLAGVYDQECYLATPSPEFKHDVIFVGSRGYHPEWQYRPQLVDWLKNTFGSRFAHYGGDGIKVVRGAELNQLYADAKVVVGDTLCIGFDYPYYMSDRIFETTGRGGVMVHPYIKGIEDAFQINEEIMTYEYGDFDELKRIIDWLVRDDVKRESLRRAGHERTKKDHTYKMRWKAILQELNHG